MAAEKLGGPLAQGAKVIAMAAGKRLLSTATDRIGETTQRLTDYTSNGGGPGLFGALTGKGGKGSTKGAAKITNIVEQLDIGVPVRVAYDQWTQFSDFPSFMKKVESVDQEDEQTLNWRAQIFLSHRTWKSTIVEQVPESRIVWKSEGPKGTVDGAITFHELAPELTRICMILEYHPQGFFEKTANLWRAPGRRARLEFKNFARHTMTQAVLHPEELQGWRGEIRDGEVVKTDEEARKGEEEQQSQERDTEGSATTRRSTSDDWRRRDEQPSRGDDKRRGRRPEEPGRRPQRSRSSSGADEERPARRPSRAAGGGRG